VLDDPIETVEKLAPYTFNTHFKDMAAEETADGFRISEVPLGEGMLDMKRIVETIRRARPDVRFSLEMITRDPLEVPCLTEKYWSTFDDVNGVRLARTLANIRAHPPKAPLPRITGLTPDERLALEMELVERSIVYARDRLGLV
jgi:sugar phosphate isomerase/epimerase